MLRLPDGVTTEEFVGRLGRRAFILPLISHQLRHRSVLSTLKDYLHTREMDAVDKAVTSFLRDLQELSTQEVVEKWYTPEAPKEFVKRVKAVL